MGEIVVVKVGSSKGGMGVSAVAEKLGKSPSVLVGIGSFLTLLVAGRKAVPAMVVSFGGSWGSGFFFLVTGVLPGLREGAGVLCNQSKLHQFWSELDCFWLCL